MINQICDFIIKTVQEKSVLSGFQYIVGYTEVFEKFQLEINQENIDLIVEKLWEREEIADIEIDECGFDVVLFSAFAPNYEED